MGKIKAENPQLSVYYNDREHVTIIAQSSSQALNTISHATHYTSSDQASHMLKYLPLVSLPLLHNPIWIIVRSRFKSHQVVLRNPNWLLHQCVCKSHALV